VDARRPRSPDIQRQELEEEQSYLLESIRRERERLAEVQQSLVREDIFRTTPGPVVNSVRSLRHTNDLTPVAAASAAAGVSMSYATDRYRSPSPSRRYSHVQPKVDTGRARSPVKAASSSSARVLHSPTVPSALPGVRLPFERAPDGHGPCSFSTPHAAAALDSPSRRSSSASRRSTMSGLSTHTDLLMSLSEASALEHENPELYGELARMVAEGRAPNMPELLAKYSSVTQALRTQVRWGFLSVSGLVSRGSCQHDQQREYLRLRSRADVQRIQTEVCDVVISVCLPDFDMNRRQRTERIRAENREEDRVLSSWVVSRLRSTTPTSVCMIFLHDVCFLICVVDSEITTVIIHCEKNKTICVFMCEGVAVELLSKNISYFFVLCCTAHAHPTLPHHTTPRNNKIISSYLL
jgi:hypothetical protein